MSGAVGSKPNLIRSGTLVAALFASFANHSFSTNNSSQPRFVCSKAAKTSGVIGYFSDPAERFVAEVSVEFILVIRIFL